MINIFLDCSCTNAVRISSNCLAQQIQDQSMGDYDQICRQDDNTLVYVNIDGGMYLYYMKDNEVKSIYSINWHIDMFSSFNHYYWKFRNG